MKTIDKEVAFLMKFKKRFKTKQGFLKATKDMANEGLIRLGSYDIVKRKLELNKRLTSKKPVKKAPVSSSFMSCDSQEQLVKHLDRESKKRKEKTPTIGSGCEGPSSWRNC